MSDASNENLIPPAIPAPEAAPVATPPADLTVDGALFFTAGEDIHLLDTPRPVPTSALKLLGASPFPKSKFPLLGFLETLYDHIATSATADLPK